jgi:Rps23 Pro-64 3,4-dihydroxylase Tpa1-like proline 4-hydroxylase
MVPLYCRGAAASPIPNGGRETMSSLEELLPLDTMESYAKRAEEYASAKPFPHIVIDDFLRENIANELIKEFPKPTDPSWLRYKAPAEKDKLQSTSELTMPPGVRGIIGAFNSSTFVKFLERLTGIEGIIPDPHLYGGGMHQTLTGGHLKMHVDYNLHQQWKLDRRLNVILYLNDHWDEDWGGALELWDSDDANHMTDCAKKYFPVANRLVIFSTTERSWHGHPDPLTCPQGQTRKSIALYYYTNGRPKEELPEFHNTIFVERPGEVFKYVTLKDVIRDIVPPILIKAARRIKGARAN